MNMIKYTKPTIDEFVKSASCKTFDNAYALAYQFLSNSMDDIMQKNSLISEYKIYVANEMFSGCEFNSSSIDIFLEVRAVQLVLNFESNRQYVLKSNIKTFINRFSNNFKIFNKKNVKQKKKEKTLKKQEEKLDKKVDYDILSFYKDLQIQLAKKAYKTTKILLDKNRITIIGKDEFGVEVNIYPVFASGDKELVLYNLNNKKETKIDFRQRFNNLEDINLKTKKLFKLQVRIFNNIFWNVFKLQPNQIFIESILFNVPNVFYTNNIFETTLGIVNYLQNSTMQNFVSICDTSIKLFKEPLNGISFEMAHKFINSIHIS